MTGGKDRMRSTTEEAFVVGLIFLSLEVETMPKKKDKDRLRLWQDRLRRAQSAYQREVDKMEDREDMYLGAKNIRPIVSTARKTETPHVRNLAAEMIESQVDSNIPQPKVTPRRRQDEWRAKLIEDMLRNELDRLPFEQINDIQERTVPIQGGAAYLVEWDNAKRTQSTIGEINVSALHPRQIVPQDGVYTGIEDMDYIFLKVPQTKGYIKRTYGVDVSDESEEEPEAKGDGGSTAEDMVTQYVAYYRNQDGGIGLFSWVNDTTLEDLEDYQARRLRRCAVCGAVEPLDGVEPAGVPAYSGLLPGMEPMGTPGVSVYNAPMEEPKARTGGWKVCPYCGGEKWTEREEDFEEVYIPIQRSDGTMIPGATTEEVVTEEVNELGLPVVAFVETPTRIPFYKPDLYPVILQKNVSVYGRFLGDSDLDKISDQQNTTNRIEAKIIDKLVKSGSYITLPNDAKIRYDEEDMKKIYLESAADKSFIDVYVLQGNIEQDLTYLGQIYEEARQVIGITDSFQGRKDSTATSGTAKEFSAAQAAGRLESKRVMKNAAYAALFEAMFKFKLAYSDEPRPVVAHDIEGKAEYKEFNRYDFLEQDESGEWHWLDDFLFSCDTSAPLANNREAMWQETRMNLQTGAFGDPTSLKTLILFWTKMEMLHYPGASDTKTFLEQEYQQQQQQQMMMMQQQMAMQQQQMEAQAVQETVSRARQDAERTVGRNTQSGPGSPMRTQ